MRSTLALRREVATACRKARSVFGDDGAVNELREAQRKLRGDAELTQTLSARWRGICTAALSDAQRALGDLYDGLSDQSDDALRRDFGAGEQFAPADLDRLYTNGGALSGVAALHHLLNTSRKDARPASDEVMRRLYFFASG